MEPVYPHNIFSKLITHGKSLEDRQRDVLEQGYNTSSKSYKPQNKTNQTDHCHSVEKYVARAACFASFSLASFSDLLFGLDEDSEAMESLAHLYWWMHRYVQLRLNTLFNMLFEVDFVERRDCVSDAVYGGGGLLVEVRSDEV